MAKRAHFEIFQKNQKHMPHVVFNEKSKTGLRLESGQQQQKGQRKPSLQSLVIPAVSNNS